MANPDADALHSTARLDHGHREPGDSSRSSCFRIQLHERFQSNGVGLFKTVRDGRPYLFTQFEATDARQAFPCWDEPGFKIPWRITVTAPDGLRVIGNMPAAETISREGTTTVEFGRTPPMPSYLVALAVGPLDTMAMPNQAAPGRIVTTAGQTNLARMASVHIPLILSALERYFGIPYPYAKLDRLGDTGPSLRGDGKRGRHHVPG